MRRESPEKLGVGLYMDQPDITLLKCKSLLTTALSIFLSSSTISIDNEFERLSP